MDGAKVAFREDWGVESPGAHVVAYLDSRTVLRLDLNFCYWGTPKSGQQLGTRH